MVNKLIYISEHDKKKQCGVYVIRNNLNTKVYIGSSVKLRERWTKHAVVLKQNKHHSGRLQNFYNKYPEAEFYFEILELVDDQKDLIAREQFYLDKFKSYDREIGYNMQQNAYSNLGTKYGPEVTAKRLATLAERGYPNRGKPSHMTGKKLSTEWKENISKGLKNSKIRNYNFKNLREQSKRAKSKPIDLITREGDILKTFTSSHEASRELNVDRKCIQKSCDNPRNHSTKGMFFQRSELTYDEIMEMRKSNPI
jgi:group I intron endonuclease